MEFTAEQRYAWLRENFDRLAMYQGRTEDGKAMVERIEVFARIKDIEGKEIEFDGSSLDRAIDVRLELENKA